MTAGVTPHNTGVQHSPAIPWQGTSPCDIFTSGAPHD